MALTTIQDKIKKYGQSLDVVVFGGGTLLDRIIRRATVGRKRRKDKTVATHTGLLVTIGNDLMVAEVCGGRGLVITSLDNITHGGSRCVLDVIRHPVYNDKHKRYRAKMDILDDMVAGTYWENKVKYDWLGALSFYFKLLKEDPSRYYCSEYCYITTRNDINYPDWFIKGKKSPHDFQKLESFRSIFDAGQNR